MNKFKFIIGFLVLPWVAKSQIVNIDKSDTADYTNELKDSFSFNTGLEIDKQKTTLVDATNTAEMSLQKYKELFLAAASYRFTYNGPEDILNAGFIHLRYRHNYKNTWQPEAFTQYQWDNKRGLMHRALGGANIRYNFWKGDHFDFNAGIGAFYEDEKWNFTAVETAKLPLDQTPVERQYIKLNSYIRFDWKPDTRNDITFNIFMQTRPNIFKPRIAPHIQWDISAGKHIGFSISFSGLYDTAPVVPISNFYYTFSNSIRLKF
ncbi:MAG: DUF481 domain-containing protein [Bacteroidetes bacterium]|nr:DUF481 domain-containing protein [Bacteroidota bacterium]